MRILTLIVTVLAFVIWFAGIVTNDDHMEIYGLLTIVLLTVFKIDTKIDSLKSNIEKRESE